MVIVLAAGEGTRMRSDIPKVLHEVGGLPLVGHAVAAARTLSPQRVLVVVGHGRDRVVEAVATIDPSAEPVVQEEQRGTGHAVATALAAADAVDGTVVVTLGDAPLLTGDTLQRLMREHAAGGHVATVLTALVDDPSGYGRILRADDGTVLRSVEDRDAAPEERAVNEVNAGVYAFDAAYLRSALGVVGTDNAQTEHYLPDVIEIARERGLSVGAVVAHDATEILGVNDQGQLAQVRRLLNDRVLDLWMRAGVTIVDPASTWIDVAVTLQPDVVLAPEVQLEGHTTVASGARIGPATTLRDSAIGARAVVVRSHVVGAQVGPDAEVGPYAYLRPGSVLGPDGKIGTFVEVKASTIGQGSKVPHLTYVGDAEIGVGSNIGASSVFVNYDGVRKHRSVVGDHCRTGSDTMFVAPVTIGDGAYTAAGSVITQDVPPGAMAVARAPQRNVERWVLRRRQGTPSAEAAERALAALDDHTIEHRPEDGATTS